MIDRDICDSVSYVPKAHRVEMLDRLSDDNQMCVYCACGRIVSLDRSEMALKLSLGKELQCTSCRNARISDEIDYMNDLYNGLIDEEI